MKKLMIAAMVASAAMFANASAVSWALDMESGSYGNNLYYVVSDADTAALVSMLATDGDVDGFRAGLDSYTVKSGTLDSAGYKEGANNPTTAALTVFVFDDAAMAADSKFWYTEQDVSDYLYTPPTTGETFEMYRTDGIFTQSTVAAVPEPTSGVGPSAYFGALRLNRSCSSASLASRSAAVARNNLRQLVAS